MDSRDIERAAKDILLSNIRNKLNLTSEEFRRVWLEASKEEKSKPREVRFQKNRAERCFFLTAPAAKI